jgi:8-oxo-dGTP pyrophosphatase MutT (NUDIX family)
MTPRPFPSDPTDLQLSVSAVVYEASGGCDLLRVTRGDDGCWGLPGGGASPGELTEEAVAGGH